MNNNVVDNAVANPASPFPLGGFFAYGPTFLGGVRVAVGDVNGDGHQDIITGAGPGGGPHVEVFSGANGQVIRTFYAYNPSFSGGVYVAAGDYDRVANGVVPGNFTADIITGAGSKGKPNITVFSGANLGVITQFFAFGADGPPSLLGADVGVSTGIGSVSIADVNGDSIPDIIVGSARGPRTRIAVFQGNSANPPRMLFTNSTPPPAGFILNPFASLSPPFFTVDNTPTNLDDLILDRQLSRRDEYRQHVRVVTLPSFPRPPERPCVAGAAFCAYSAGAAQAGCITRTI